MAAMVEDDLIRIVAHALADAREKGLDDVDQTGHAVRAVLAARPDMTASEPYGRSIRGGGDRGGPTGLERM